MWSQGPPKWISVWQILLPGISHPEGTLEVFSCKAKGWRVLALEISTSTLRKKWKGSLPEEHPRPCQFLLNGRKAASLLRGQLGVPHVHDEDQPERWGILPHLMLERVIKDEHLAFFPCPGKENHALVRMALAVLHAWGPVSVHRQEDPSDYNTKPVKSSIND